MEKWTALKPDEIEKIVSTLEKHQFQCWFYGDSIGFEGLLAGDALLGKSSGREWIYGYLKAWAARMEPWRADDNTAPGHVMCEIQSIYDDEFLFNSTLRLAEHLQSRRRHKEVSITFEDASRSIREPYGDYTLSEEDKGILKEPGAGIYLDCLHFDPPFLAHLCKLTGDTQWGLRAVQEAKGHIELLYDRETGLFCHFWLERSGRAYTPGWGRGQGWALLGLLDVLELLPEDTPGRAGLAKVFKETAETMLRYQLADGNWYAVVQHKESKMEASTAAFMATALWRGMMLGLLDESFAAPALRAWNAVLQNIQSDGVLAHTSAAVYSSTLPQHYWHVPIGFNVPWGQGPALTAALAGARYHSQ